MSLAAYASKTKKRLVIKNMQDSLANEHFRVKYTCKSCVQHHLAVEINLESGFHVILKVHDQLYNSNNQTSLDWWIVPT